MPGLFSGIATALTAVAGLIGVLHETGYLANRPPLTPSIAARAPVPQQMRERTGQFAALDVPVASGQPAFGRDQHPLAMAPRPRNLNGAWRDGASNCHLIKQNGHALTVTSYFADNRLWGVGTGTIKGGVIAVRLNSANPASAEADLILSDDGREMSGMMKWAKGTHVARWRFVGPSCLETAARPD